MRTRRVRAHDLLTWSEAFVLLSAWIVQQTFVEETAAKLSKLSSAKVNTWC